MPKTPAWATPERKQKLVKLFCDSGGFCVFGHENCLVPSHHYEIFIEYLIDDWKLDDRETWRAERLAMHDLGERRLPISGRWGAISQDIYHDKQPLYFVEGLGIDGIRLEPFAKIRIGSSYIRLFVGLGDTLRKVSKNKRRKCIRYGKTLPKRIDVEVSQKILKAVKDYLGY